MIWIIGDSLGKNTSERAGRQVAGSMIWKHRLIEKTGGMVADHTLVFNVMSG
jgi:hypothetical protein